MKNKVIKIDGKAYKEAHLIVEPIQNYKELPPSDFIGYLFKNSNGVYSILTEIEDIIKSNSYFNAIPQNLFLVSDEKVIEGDCVVYNGDACRIHSGRDFRIPMGLLIVQPFKYIVLRNEKKIVAALNNKNIPRLSNEFMKSFINKQGEGFDKVLVEYQEFWNFNPSIPNKFEINIAPDNTITTKRFE